MTTTTPDILARRETHFLLWRPAFSVVTPSLFIGSSENLDAITTTFVEVPLQASSGFPDLWELDANTLVLEEGKVYYYWFKIGNTEPYDAASRNQVLYATDPLAMTIDRRVPAPLPLTVPVGMTGISSMDPASVICFKGGKLVPSDPDGSTVNWAGDPSPASLPANNRLVIYELPTRWTRITSRNSLEVGNGTFQDTMALLVPELSAPTFPSVAALNNRAHLIELGVNALELLPPSDSEQSERWGYGTANFFAADFELGFPAQRPGGPSQHPHASTVLVDLIRTCHQNGIRFIKDSVMAFATGTSLRNINYLDFFIKSDSGDPEQQDRNGFGGDLLKLALQILGYDPIGGSATKIYPSRAFLKTYLYHWLTYYRVDGLRLDSVNNIRNYDFLEEIKNFSRTIWKERGGSDDNFLVIGESIGFEREMLKQKRLDSFWNEDFKDRVKPAVVGKNYKNDRDFEATVRKMIDCRTLGLGFSDGSQVINYITSHDVEGEAAERLYTYLEFNKVYKKEERVKLAFTCLLTAVGIPMILAGEEFADRMDNDIFSKSKTEGEVDELKQIDPVNFSRLDDEWRNRVFQYVARLVKFRIQSDALAVNDTKFLHTDFSDGKRVMVWQRGTGSNLVVVVANFSDWGTDARVSDPRYVVPNWPELPPGREWIEITQERKVPREWAGMEPLYPWEGKVYAMR